MECRFLNRSLDSWIIKTIQSWGQLVPHNSCSYYDQEKRHRPYYCVSCFIYQGNDPHIEIKHQNPGLTNTQHIIPPRLVQDKSSLYPRISNKLQHNRLPYKMLYRLLLTFNLLLKVHVVLLMLLLWVPDLPFDISTRFSQLWPMFSLIFNVYYVHT